MKYLSLLLLGTTAFAQPEVITNDFRLLNPVTNYKIYSALARTIDATDSANGFKITLPGLIECTVSYRKRDANYLCSLLKGGWKTHKETVLSGRGELELASWEKDGQRLYDALGTSASENTRDGVGEDFVTHKLFTKAASSCSGYDPISLTGLYSYRLDVSKEGEFWYTNYTASVRVMMDRPVYECP